MKTNQSSILIFGHDEHLLATRQWVLQTRGYRVQTIQHLSAIGPMPPTPEVHLLVLCYSLSLSERDTAVTLARARWPEIKVLPLIADPGRAPDGILGQLLHTKDGPAKLVSQVGALMGPASSYSAAQHP